MADRPANRLAAEGSPYLRQHAHNPVDWYPWGEEALRKARLEDKPLLVSIGYAACHWCHVMERESFEDPAVAALMNDGFVNVKVDREERPDLDQIYMGAVQAMTGSGGWPLNVFCTPDGRPFTGGTYFPPRDLPARPAWTTVLRRVLRAFGEQRARVEEQADLLLEHLGKLEGPVALSDATGAMAAEGAWPADAAARVREQLFRHADREHGGFGRAPKFPSVHALRALLRAGVADRDPEALDHVRFSLDAMMRGGIHDLLGGGFARYATDDAWLVPHFEKMLYDNALLLSELAEAAQASRDEAEGCADAGRRAALDGFALRAKRAAHGIVDWADREMRHPDGAFHATLDADSEGVEGKFYTWSVAEIDALLGPDATEFRRVHGVRDAGNWEGVNILHRPLAGTARDPEAEPAVAERMAACRRTLFAHREGRVRPGLDDKVLLGWNALFCSGLYAARAAFGEDRYARLADDALAFLRRAMDDGAGGLRRVWQEGRARGTACLDDAAAWIEALLDAAERPGGEDVLREALRVTDWVGTRFSAADGVWYHYAASGQDDVVVRTVDRFDGATPSGNATMAGNLLRLGRLADRPEHTARGQRLLAAMAASALSHPSAHGVWACRLLEEAAGRDEVAIVGPRAGAFHRALRERFRPGALFQAAESADPDWPLLRDRDPGPDTRIFVCRDYACARPVDDPGRVSYPLA
jgi:uncharacterized protein YyaL (SSP411 family)